MVVRLVSVLIAAVGGLLFGTAAVHLAEAALGGRKLSTPHCPYCTAAQAPLQWSATMAVLTGQAWCATCGRFLRVPRLLGELFLMLTWGLLIARYGVTGRVLLALLTLVPLTMILVTDLEAKLVPNRIMLPALAGMLLVGTLVGPALPFLDTVRWWHVPLGAAVGFMIFRLLVWLGVALFGEGALGEGDITLATYVGAVVGFPMVLEALVLTFGFGGVGAALVLILRRGKLRTAIPYGPFLILGCAVTQLWGAEILHWFLG